MGASVFVCAVISQKGGAGKSTMVIHLAVEAMRVGYEVAIVDLDPQGTAEAWGDWRKGAPPVVIPAKAGSLAKTLKQAEAHGAEIVFIDTPPLAQADASAAARAADFILVPCRPRAFDLHAVRITASLLEMIKKPAFAVFNGGNPATTKGYDEPTEVMAAIGLQVSPCRLSERAAFHQATMTGQTAHELDWTSHANTEVRRLWIWLCNQSNIQADKRNKEAKERSVI
jgi:chromosome partitioning protein